MAEFNRKIIHVDMDAFFASIEQLDRLELRNKPIAVGYDGPRGVVATASYEARKFGVKSAMPSFKARQLCKDLLFVRPRFDRYREISLAIKNILQEYSDKIEPLSLDEAYIDVTTNKKQLNSAIHIAKLMKKEVHLKTGLTASAGVSINKFLAKVASDIHKPDGLSVILPENVQQFLDHLPIEKFYGIGKATGDKMKSLGIHNGFDLRQRSEIELVKWFGKQGRYYYQVARGLDNREVETRRIRKSISVERTYETDIIQKKQITKKLEELTELLISSLNKKDIRGRTIHLKIRYNDFETLTRSKSMQHYSREEAEIQQIVMELFEALNWKNRPVRLLGVGISNLDSEVEVKQMEIDF